MPYLLSNYICDSGSPSALVILWDAVWSLFNLSASRCSHLVKRAPLPSLIELFAAVWLKNWLYERSHLQTSTQVYKIVCCRSDLQQCMGTTQRKTLVTNQTFFSSVCELYHTYTHRSTAEVIFCFPVLNPPPVSLSPGSAVSITLVLAIPPRLLCYHPSISVPHFISQPIPPFLTLFPLSDGAASARSAPPVPATSVSQLILLIETNHSDISGL